jgi:hypothetical protein
LIIGCSERRLLPKVSCAGKGGETVRRPFDDIHTPSLRDRGQSMTWNARGCRRSHGL